MNVNSQSVNFEHLNKMHHISISNTKNLRYLMVAE